MRRFFLVSLCLLAAAGVWLFWPQGGRVVSSADRSEATKPPLAAASAISNNTAAFAAAKATFLAGSTNRLAYRLTNTKKSLMELTGNRHAILLQNALIDTEAGLALNIPERLKSAGDPGAYIVQARGVIDARFRSLLTSAGAQVVSYIPNNAYLVRLTAAGAGALSASSLVQAVLPYEPYYKLQPSLLGLAVKQEPLPPGTALTLGLFTAEAAATKDQLVKLGAQIIGTDQSPFGPVVRVLAPENWTPLAQVPGVQVVEPVHYRKLANDLARVTLGISIDTTTNANWLNLDGHNVMVDVNDTGIDDAHDDFSIVAPGTSPPSRVTGDDPLSLNDTDGHGTHVAGIIAGNGSMSSSISNVPQGSVSGANFRGKAPKANLFSVGGINGGHDPNAISDYYFQSQAAQTNALISNNSWVFEGDFDYDLAASSYDAASRDSLPFRPGSQPVLYVFAAGNSGGGTDSGSGGSADTILSPGTAKNVITVGALEQIRNLTNIVTDAQSNQSAIWMTQSDSGSQVAYYSSRGNVGVGTEGAFGRFKPDVVAPGSWVVSTRPSMWDTNAFYNPTNIAVTHYVFQTVATNGLTYYTVSVPPNAVSVTITITSNKLSKPFPPDLPIYVKQSAFPTTTVFDFKTSKDGFDIPGDAPLAPYLNSGFAFAVGNTNSVPVNYDLRVAIGTTNNLGNYYQVLKALNDTLAPWYRYESGTSMAAPAISGVLALIQDYFTNTLNLTPSPALLKAMLINGSRLTGSYTYAVTNGNNFQGWGLANIANTLPLTNNTAIVMGAGPSVNSPLFIVDQSPANALATGDSHTYIVNVNTNSGGDFLFLQATLVWTDPPGDPSAAIKLVNNLDLVMTNLDTGEVYVGNDIAQELGYNLPMNTNGLPTLDAVNNVENIILPPLLAGRYSVTVIGRLVNVNAVTLQTNNVVQDYALVVAVGEGEVADAIASVTDSGIASQPTSSQQITFISSTNSPLFNQFAGENSPLLGTNKMSLGSNTVWGSTGVLTVGQTNQWHFYVVTNTGLSADVTNAAFITFDSLTLSIPRMGVFEDGVDNATRPQADIDIYVTTDPSLTNLNPATIANCLAGSPNSGASLGQGGTEFVAFSNSAPGKVYYIGVKSEDHEASEYAFLPIFTSTPFSALDKDGNQIVNGQLLPVNIPDGNNAHPGFANVFALAIYPMQVAKVTVTNLNEHQNFGDLFGAMTFGSSSVVLNNHDGLGNTFNTFPLVYDDSRNPAIGSQHTDGPGTLTTFRGKPALGPWILGEQDNSLTLTGRVSQFTLRIQPHRDLRQPGVVVTIPPGGWFIDYIDVPPGYTNLTFYATNLPPTSVPPIQMYEKLGNEPTLTDYDQRADLTNGVPPGNSISIGPPLPLGRYFIGLFNPSSVEVTVFLSATLGIDTSANTTFDYASTNGVQALFDDAVTDSGSIFVGATQLVASVNVGFAVTSPRISDLTFTLVSPDGQRVLLMENRGGSDTNGAGGEFIYTNVVNSKATGGASASTNYIDTGLTGGSIPITYNFYTAPDQMTVYYGTNIDPAYLVFNSGMTSNPSLGPGPQNTQPITANVTYPGTALAVPASTILTIIMNQFGNTNSDTAWTYTAGAIITNFQYLVFTDDTNLTTVPIKFAQPPYSFTSVQSNFMLCDFELATNGYYFGPTNIYDVFGGWTVPTNLVTVTTVLNVTNGLFAPVTNKVVLTNNYVSVVADPHSSLGGDSDASSNYLALAKGTITRSIATVPGRTYNVTFWYRGPGISSWWRGEGNGTDSSDPENNGNNGTLVGRFNFPAGEVGQAFQYEDRGSMFQFAGTNTYVQAQQNSSLDVGKGGGFTVEGWINPTNLVRPQPLVEWLASVPTNPAVTNLVIKAGPYLNQLTGHYYYLLGATNWTVSEVWAQSLGGHLVTIDSANEQNWVFDNFASYGGFNRNLWLGLTNNAGAAYGWSGGLTNFTYTNWLASQPLNNNGTFRNYTFMFGATNLSAGLWTLADNNGFTQSSPGVTNKVYGVAEVNEIQTNGVQFWVSATNRPGTTNVAFVNGGGALYANLVDTNYVSHEIFSAPGLLQSNVYQHVALTYDTNSGIAMLYLNGTNVATTNLGVFVPKTDGDVLLGRDLSRYTNNYYGGKMDEMSIYRRALSRAEINAIYQSSALATNGLAGKFDPAVVPAYGLSEAVVDFGGNTNLIFGLNNQWEVNSYTFVATTNTMPLRITGLEPGILLDQFAVSQAPLTNLYYLPEQQLEALTGISAFGNWTLQVWDNRAGAALTNFSQLLSWQLSFVLQSNATFAASLQPQMPTSGTVPPGQTVYFLVPVPSWAQFATNILVSSSQPVDLLFNPTNLPTGSNPGDLTLLTGSTGGVGTPVLSVNQPFPLTAANQAGSSYILGVRNSSIHSAAVVLEVDYDIIDLTNGIPYTSVLTTNVSDNVRYYSFTVSSNAQEATFQLLKMTGNADLVARKGIPLPTLTNTAYGSFNATNVDENIFVLTNSSPVPLSAGKWYLGVIKRSSGTITNTILAKELNATNTYTIIDLTNNVPVNWTAGPGAALTNFFRFHVTNSVVGGVTNLVQGLRFELYNLDGNGDLNVQPNTPPLSPPFFQSSQNTRRSPELVLVFTNSALTNLAADWYLGVPNHETQLIHYSIVAAIETNAYFPAFPGAFGSGGDALGAGHAGVVSTVYHVTTNSNSGPGSLRDAVNTTNRTVVFDISGPITLTSPLTITNSNLTIAGQTAPGGGITVAGDMTTLASAHDVIIRHVRFRRGAIDDSLMFTNVLKVIADHVSAEWSDTALSTLNSSNVTVQWSIMADSLLVTNNPAPMGSQLRYGSGSLTFHHNLYADNYSGSPRLGDNLSLDFVNNVIYNWGLFSGLSGGTNDLLVSTNGCTNMLNYVCNYLIAGPDTARYATNFAITNIAFFGGGTNALAANWVFQTNNFIDSDTNGILNGANTKWAMFTNKYTQFGQRFPLVPVPTDEAFMAYERVLDFAGVNMAGRDSVDASIVTGVRNQTGTIISSPPLAGLVALWKGEGNANDSIGINNGTFPNGTGFTTGKVGTAFNFNGVNQFMLVSAANSALDIGQGTGFTAEAWINPSSFSKAMLILEYERILQSFSGNDVGLQFSVSSAPGNGDLVSNIKDNTGVDHIFYSNPGVLVTGVWQHVALTYDKASGVATYYCNGVVAGTTSMGSFTPQTSFTNFLTARTFFNSVASPNAPFAGGMDELSLYKRALSTNEIVSIYTAGSAGKFASVPASSPLYLDTDQDGIPDFWEMTFTTNLVFVPSNNNERDGDGYNDLEEYINWLAVPHAVTVTNTPVSVDLMQVFGKTGNLSFSVTNGINGSVYLTNVIGTVTNTGPFSNSIAVFVPVNTTPVFSGYASFDVYSTNNTTIAGFGPVTVSVVVSAVPVAINSNMPPVIITLTNALPYTNSNAGGSDYYRFTVPTNAIGVLFDALNPSGDVTLVARYGLPLPSLSSYDYISTNSGTANEHIVVTTNSTPIVLTSGDWYLAVINVSGGPVTYSAKATLFTNLVPPVFFFPTNTTIFTNVETTLFTNQCVAVDSNTPALPLTYSLVSGPAALTVVSSNGFISWIPTEAQGPSTNTISISVSDGAFSVTNTFSIIVQESNLPPVLPAIPVQLAIGTNLLVVNNTATDPDLPVNALGYVLTSTVPGANAPSIDPNTGVITWTAIPADYGTNYVFTTVVTDTNPWAINTQSFSVTNSFTVVVLPLLPPGDPKTNTVPPGGINWLVVQVPTNALAATNILLFATNLPVNVWFSTNLPPTITNANDAVLIPNGTNGVSVLTTSSAPTNIAPGKVYFLGVQNTNSFAVTYGLQVDFLLAPPTLVTNPFTISSIVYTNISGTNGFLLTWFAPTNYFFQVQWTPTLAPTVWTTFPLPPSIGYNLFISPTNSRFQFFDDGSQTGGFGPTRFYRLLLSSVLLSANTLTLPLQSNRVVNAASTVTVNNAATDSNPTAALTYSLVSSPVGASISTNGIITWTNATPSGIASRFTTLVTDNGTPSASATNTFTVFVMPFPSITNVTTTATSTTLSWVAPTNDTFQVQWATNLAPVVNWFTFPSILTSTTGTFTFTDTNTPLAMKFYRLLLLP